MKIDLLIIDPQMDFMDYPGHAGALAVNGGHADMRRVARLVKTFGASLNNIHVTLDSHHVLDIAHPTWWMDSFGHPPAPFTLISEEDVKGGKWRARIPEFAKRSAEYVHTLAEKKRYLLCIWPEHCIIGSAGHSIHPEVLSELCAWERKKLAVVDMVSKGSNPLTEHYSGLKAEVPDAEDASTQLNMRLIQTLEKADMVLIAGEALSHCVANTVRDIASVFDPSAISKLVLLEDCCSSVSGFENLGVDFMAELRAMGMKVMKSTDFSTPRAKLWKNA